MGSVLNLDSDERIQEGEAKESEEEDVEGEEICDDQRKKVDFETPSPVTSRVRGKFRCPILNKDYDAIKFVPGEPIPAEKRLLPSPPPLRSAKWINS